MNAMKALILLGAPIVSRASKSAGFRRMVFNAVRLQRAELKEMQNSRELQFLAYVFSKRSRSQSQILQDLWVCFESGEKQNGFFVEFGATNGRVNSNTWLLEKEMGWRGILAEPNPYWHVELAANRGAHIEHRCVSSATGNTVRFMATDEVDPELSGILEFGNGDHFTDIRADAKELAVTTVSLMDLLAEWGAPSVIDYLSVDTEGSEYEILSHFDFSKYDVKLLSVEHNKKTEAAIDTLLIRNGFKRVFKEMSQWDAWYVRNQSSAEQQSG